MRKQKVLIVCLSFAIVSLIGCAKSSPTAGNNNAGNSSPLVGTWNMTTQVTTHASGASNTVNASATRTNQYIFKSDNTYDNVNLAYGSTSTWSGTWSTTADTVTIILLMQPTKFKYSIAGGELTLISRFSVSTDSGTVTEKYTKQ